MAKRRSIALGLAVLALLAGCGPRRPSVSADVFLEHSMAKYRSLNSFKAGCYWTATDGKRKFDAQRRIEISAPNRFKVESIHDNSLLLASVCDGTQVTEYSNVPGMLAGITPPPQNIAGDASPQMANPLDTGSPLYLWFSSNTPKARYVGDAETIDGEPCATVSFAGPADMGEIRATIGIDDKLVHTLVWDAAKTVNKQSGKADVSAPSSGAPWFKQSIPLPVTHLTVTETFHGLDTSTKVADADFDTALPNALPEFRMAEDTTTPGGEGAGTAGNLGDPPVPLGNPAPDISVVDAKTGSTVKLSSMKGQVVVLDFWATWCGPCRMSLPETETIYSQNRSKGLTVMAIDGEDRKTINEFVKSNNYTFPAYHDPNSGAMRTYRADAIPTIAVIDREGRLQFYGVGLQEKSTLAAALAKAGL